MDARGARPSGGHEDVDRATGIPAVGGGHGVATSLGQGGDLDDLVDERLGAVDDPRDGPRRRAPGWVAMPTEYAACGPAAARPDRAPLRCEGHAGGTGIATPSETTLLILGAGGDLTHRLLLPGIGQPAEQRRSPTGEIRIVGADAADLSAAQWKARVKDVLLDGEPPAKAPESPSPLAKTALPAGRTCSTRTRLQR